VRRISFMDLEAPRDEVLTQKDQANTCVSTAWLRFSRPKLGILVSLLSCRERYELNMAGFLPPH
jgi:hypothetical protein